MRAAIIVPTYNERENLPALVEAIRRQPLVLRLIVVDDNSPDGTGEVADGIAARVPEVSVLHRPAKQGYGRALAGGFRMALERFADFDAIVTMDADFSHAPAALPTLLAALSTHDVAVGSRYVSGGGVSNWEMHRRLLSRCGNAYTRVVTGLPVHDCTSGFVAYRRQVIQALSLNQLHAHGYSCLIEMKFRASLLGFSLTEVPITFVERSRGASKMSLSIAAEAVVLAWRLRRMRALHRAG